jgi:hypothetical protein
LRPCLEALLIIGKFVDDVANAKTWREREVDPKALPARVYEQCIGIKISTKECRLSTGVDPPER